MFRDDSMFRDVKTRFIQAGAPSVDGHNSVSSLSDKPQDHAGL